MELLVMLAALRLGADEAHRALKVDAIALRAESFDPTLKSRRPIMPIMSALAVSFALLAHPAHAQAEQAAVIKSCPVLTNAEAAAVLGDGTIFASGAEAKSGTTRISLLCEFVQGERTLTVTASKTLGTKEIWEQHRKLSNGTVEPGLGDYAYSEIEDGNPHFLVVKGPLTLSFRIGGKGGSAADVPKLREAAKKAVVKL